MPNKDIDDPSLAKLLRESELPRCKKSNTDKLDPRRANVRKDRDEPRVA
jgi:hypothetical protein